MQPQSHTGAVKRRKPRHRIAGDQTIFVSNDLTKITALAEPENRCARPKAGHVAALQISVADACQSQRLCDRPLHESGLRRDRALQTLHFGDQRMRRVKDRRQLVILLPEFRFLCRHAKHVIIDQHEELSLAWFRRLGV